MALGYSLGMYSTAACNICRCSDCNCTATTENPVVITQYATPSEADTVQVAGTGQSVWLINQPASALVAITLKYPPVASVLDKQEVSFNTTQAITSLNTDANGASVVGAPAGLAQFGFFTMRFDGVMKIWYRVG